MHTQGTATLALILTMAVFLAACGTSGSSGDPPRYEGTEQGTSTELLDEEAEWVVEESDR